MNRRNWLSSLTSNSALNPTQWPAVNTATLPPLKAVRFRMRKRALDLYFEGDLSVAQILTKCGLSKPELYRIRDRALTAREDGQVWGYLACIPGFHIKSYELAERTKNARAGTVAHFFGQHPDLHELIVAWALGKKSPDVGVVRGRYVARIWAGFEAACKARDIDLEQAPSRESIRRLCGRIRRQHFKKGVRMVGGKDAADIASSGLGRALAPPAIIPYQRTQLDGHRLDAVITVEVLDSDGTYRDLPLERLWLLVIIDKASRAILGYQLSLGSNYNSDDVLDCVAHALKPWAPRDVPSERIAYKPGAGLPSGVLPKGAWRAFDSLAFDNAMSHTSCWMQERVIGTIGCEINTGRPARALSRAIVERFFRTFEDESLHRWPSTTGSAPGDPRRHKTDQAAERLKIAVEDLEFITDITVANYNATPHKSLNGRSPLEYIRYYDDQALSMPRHLPSSVADALPLYDREFERRIAGNAKIGRRPYVTFMGSHYRNEALALLIDQIGKPIRLVVNVRDVRRIQGFLSDGSCIGTLVADDPWLRQPHSLRTRRAILKLIKDGELSRETFNPVGDHLKYLAKRARKTRRDRNALIKQAREAGLSMPGQAVDAPKQTAHPSVRRRRHISITDTFTQ